MQDITNNNTTWGVESAKMNDNFAEVRKIHPVFNYFPNFNLIADVRSATGNKSDIGSDWDIVNGTLFNSHGFSSFLYRNHSEYGSTKMFSFGSDYFRESFISNKTLKIKFLMLSASDRTAPFRLYRKTSSTFTSIYSNNISLQANVIKEVEMTIDLSLEDFSLIEYFQFFFENMSAGEYYIAGVLIYDGSVPFNLASNLIGRNDLMSILDTGKYQNKRWMFIGDSISFQNDRHWKGYLKNRYGINYLNEYNYTYKCAEGGKPLFPPITENTENYSIWYLCGNQRLTDYPAELINLFGGTNDLGTGDDVIDLGTAADTPYLDTDAERPEGLTWASAFKGCVEMLQRDFPNVEIVVCTVLDYKGGVAKSAYGATGYSRSEYMARLQMQIADDYGLKCVPWFWCSGIQTDIDGITDTYDLFTSDGVHPNSMGATRMVRIWADTLLLV